MPPLQCSGIKQGGSVLDGQAPLGGARGRAGRADTEAVKKRRQDTSHGAWGTVAEFRAQGREGLKQREEKVNVARAAKQAKEEAANEKREARLCLPAS